MASFYNSPNPTSDPNYLGYSKEPDKIKANTSFGDLFGSAGTMLGEGAAALDRGFQDVLKKDVRDTLQPIIEAHSGNPDEATGIGIAGTGSRSGATVGADGTISAGGALTPAQTMPDGLTGQMSNVERIKKIYAAGKMSEAHFDISVDKALRDMRAKYPAYDDQIDAFGKSFLGTSMANEVRKDVLSAMNSQAAAAQSAQSKLETRWQQDEQYFSFIGVSKSEFFANPQAFEDQIAGVKADDYRITREKNRLQLSDKKDENLTRDTSRLAGSEVDFYTRNVVGSSLNQLRSQANQLSLETNPDPSKVRATAAQAQVLYNNVSAKIDDILAQKVYSNLTPEQKNQIKAQRLDPIKNILQTTNGGQFEIAGAISKQVTNEAHLSTLEWNRTNPIGARIKTMRDQLGPEITSALDSIQKGKIFGDLNQSIVNSGWLQVANKGSVEPPATIGQIENGIKYDPSTKQPDPGRAVKPQERQAILSGLIVLRDGKDKEVAGRAVQSIYDPAYFSKITDRKELMNMWRYLSRPDVSQKVAEIDKTYMGAGDTYRKFNETLFRNVFDRMLVDETQQARTRETFFDWKIENGSVALYPKERNAKLAQYDMPTYRAAEAKLASDVNQVLRVMRPMYEALGMDPDQSIQRLVEIWGVGKQGPQPVLFDSLMKAFEKAPHEQPLPKEKAPIKKSEADDALPKGASLTQGFAPEDIMAGLDRITNGVARSVPGQTVLNRETGKYEPYVNPNTVPGKSQERVRKGPFLSPAGL